MFCEKCGTQMEDDARFCPSCGKSMDLDSELPTATVQPVTSVQPIAVPGGVQPVAIVHKKKKSTGLFIAIGVIVLVLLIALFSIFVLGSDNKKLQKQLSLGEKYMDELKYDAAIAAYMEAIEIDPKCVEAYSKLAEIYVALDDYASAKKILNTGIRRTKSEELEAQLEEVQELEEIYELGLMGNSTDSPKEQSTDAEVNTSAAAEEYQEVVEAEPEETIQEEERKTMSYQVIHYMDDGSFVSDTITYYDENGLITSIVVDRQDGKGYQMQNSYQYECDANGNPICCYEYGSTGDLYETITYTYDLNGNKLTEYTEYADSNSGKLSGYTYQYDSENRMIKMSYSGVEDYSITYQYNADGLLEIENDMSQSNPKTSYYTYNEKGNICEVTIEYHGEYPPATSSTVVYKYDDQDRLIIKQTDNDGEVFCEEYYTYEGDSKEPSSYEYLGMWGYAENYYYEYY